MTSARTLIRGITALAILATLTLGLPCLLLRISGSPIPDAIPTWDQTWTGLTSRDDGTLLLGLLKYAAWAGWALFAASLMADLIARARGISVPRLGPQQQLASGLVSAVVAITVAIPAGGTAATAGPTQAPHQTISTTTAADQGSTASAVSWRASLTDAAAAPRTLSHQAAKFTQYTVRPGDCLWDIAWNELGDPERWPELWETSRHLRQPGGERITDPDHIEPGWTILIPTSGKPSTTGAEPSHRPAPSRHAAPLVTTPLDLTGILADRDANARPAVTTPLSVHPSNGAHEVSSAQDGALDRWATAVLRQDDPMQQRGAWRARISGAIIR